MGLRFQHFLKLRKITVLDSPRNTPNNAKGALIAEGMTAPEVLPEDAKKFGRKTVQRFGRYAMSVAGGFAALSRACGRARHDGYACFVSSRHQYTA